MLSPATDVGCRAAAVSTDADQRELGAGLERDGQLSSGGPGTASTALVAAGRPRRRLRRATGRRVRRRRRRKSLLRAGARVARWAVRVRRVERTRKNQRHRQRRCRRYVASAVIFCKLASNSFDKASHDLYAYIKYLIICQLQNRNVQRRSKIVQLGGKAKLKSAI